MTDLPPRARELEIFASQLHNLGFKGIKKPQLHEFISAWFGTGSDTRRIREIRGELISWGLVEPNGGKSFVIHPEVSKQDREAVAKLIEAKKQFDEEQEREDV